MVLPCPALTWDANISATSGSDLASGLRSGQRLLAARQARPGRRPPLHIPHRHVPRKPRPSLPHPPAPPRCSLVHPVACRVDKPRGPSPQDAGVDDRSIWR
eukprot:3712784-Rhodomonas_salina.1